MKKINLFIVVLASVLIFSCGKSGKNESTGMNDMKKDSSAQNEKPRELNASGENVSTVEYKCDGMTCTGCEKTISKSVLKVEGVKDIVADFKSKSVKVAFDKTKTSDVPIEKAINDVNYKTEKIIK
jgi:copper chaperone CopZ